MDSTKPTRHPGSVCLVGWLLSWLLARLVGWLVGWLVGYCFLEVAAPHNGQRSQGGKTDLKMLPLFVGNSHHQNQYMGTHMFIYNYIYIL